MKLSRFLLPAVFMLAVAFALPAQALQVTVTIPPLAGMVAPLLDQDDQIEVLLKPGVSPHGFQLKPSHLRLMSDSGLLITAGTPVDAWVDKYAQRIPAQKIRLSELKEVEKLPIRKGGLWEKKLPKAAGYAHDEHHEKSPLNYDGHIWMSVNNARIMVQAVSQWLQEQNPQEADAYRERETVWLKKLQQQDQMNRERLQTVQDKAFFVLHDAFQYFEAHYNLKGIGSVRLNPEIPPSLKRLGELRQKIKQSQVKCVFQEPQFPSKQMQRLTSGTATKIDTLDPMGTSYILADKTQKKNYLLYDRFTEYLTDSFMQCLAEQ